MKRVRLLSLALLIFATGRILGSQKDPEWVTILVHGAVAVKANLTGRTISLIKKDCIEDSTYERNVMKIREHPYLFTIQPIGKLGLHKVAPNPLCVNAAHLYSLLYTDIAKMYGLNENNTFYTYGWSGLISVKGHYNEARTFYRCLKQFIQAYPEKRPKIRLIGYSHGSTMFFNMARIRATEYCDDTFAIDEIYCLGLPVTKRTTEALKSPLFRKIYNIYSKSDKIQRLDVFTSSKMFSDRIVRRCPLGKLTQIELRMTAPLRRLPGQVLPSNMRGIINQAPGHGELWSFGWTTSLYRKNLHMYPLCAGIFIPYLVYAAQQIPQRHVKIDIRPEEERAFVQDPCSTIRKELPFMSLRQYDAVRQKALDHHPNCARYCETFKALKDSKVLQSYT